MQLAGDSGLVLSHSDSGRIRISNRPETEGFASSRFTRRYQRRTPSWKFALGRHREVTEMEIEILARKYGRRFDVAVPLVMAVVKAESNFDPQAVSKKGALGLMQLMPGTAKLLRVSDPFNPEENIRGGTQYLSMMLERFGEPRHALAAYNAGPNVVDKYGGVPPYRETRVYLSRVLKYAKEYAARMR